MAKYFKNAPQSKPTPTPVAKVKKDYSFLYMCIGFVVVFLISYTYVFNGKLDLNGDNFAYLLLGKSMSLGEGYSQLYSPGQPSASHFPPGYPAILSIFMFLNIHSATFFIILNGLFFLASVCLLAYWLKSVTNNAFAFSIGVIILLNTGLLSYATMVMSEIPYLFFVCLTFFSLYKLNERNDFWRSPYFYIMIIAATTAYYIRSVTLSLLAAIFIYYLLQKRWKLLASFLGGFVVLYMPWFIRGKMLGIEDRYIKTTLMVNPWRPEEGQITTVGGFINKLIKNFDETVVKGFKEVMFPFMEIDYSTPSDGAAILGIIIILAIMFYGAWNLGKYKYLVITYIAANIGVFLLWHGGNGARYVHPLAPFILITFFWGIISLLKKVKVFNKENILCYSILIFALFMFKPLTALQTQNKMPYPPAYKNYFEIAKSLNPKKTKKLNEDIVVCCRKPEIFTYYANCYVINYEYTLDRKLLIEKLIENNVTYVMLEQLGYSSTARYLYPAIEQNPHLFKTVLHLPNPDTYLLAFDRQKAIEDIKNNEIK